MEAEEDSSGLDARDGNMVISRNTIFSYKDSQTCSTDGRSLPGEAVVLILASSTSLPLGGEGDLGKSLDIYETRLCGQWWSKKAGNTKEHAQRMGT